MAETGLAASNGAPARVGAGWAAGEADSKFRLVVLTVQRAKQLRNGARPRVEVGDHKHSRVALIEVAAGLVSWSLMEPHVS